MMKPEPTTELIAEIEAEERTLLTQYQANATAKSLMGASGADAGGTVKAQEKLVERWRRFGDAFEREAEVCFANDEYDLSRLALGFQTNAKTFRQCADELEKALKEDG